LFFNKPTLPQLTSFVKPIRKNYQKSQKPIENLGLILASKLPLLNKI
jgi:hypothetical protein